MHNGELLSRLDIQKSKRKKSTVVDRLKRYRTEMMYQKEIERLSKEQLKIDGKRETILSGFILIGWILLFAITGYLLR